MGTPSICTSSSSTGANNTPKFVPGLKGVTAVRLYGDDCAGGAYGLIVTVPVENLTLGAFPGVVDSGAARGAAPPTLNTTGQGFVAGPFSKGKRTIAQLPSTCPQPGSELVITNQTSPCTYNATPVATATAGVQCPVFCDSSANVWHIH